MAISPLPSWGPKRGRNCYATRAFLGIPKNRDKIKSGSLTPAFSAAHKWAELLRNPCILGDPQQRGQNQKGLPHPCLLGGPHVGGIATSPLRSRGALAKGTKSEVAASPLPSPGPTKALKGRGRTSLPSSISPPPPPHPSWATPTPLKGKEASTEQSVESPEARPQPSMATPIEEDARPKVLIRGEWRKDGYPRDASGELECDQLFINDPAKQLVAELRGACHLNPNPGAKAKSSDTKTDVIYKRAFCNYL